MVAEEYLPIYDPTQPDLQVGSVCPTCEGTKATHQEMPPLPSGLIATTMLALIGATAVIGFMGLTGWKPKSLREK